MESGQKTYEIGYLLTPLLPEEKVPEEVSVLRKTIEDKSGLIMAEDSPKMQKLAYPIKKIESAYFGRIKFYAKPEVIGEVRGSVDKNERVVRFLINGAATEAAQAKPRRIVKIPKPISAAPEEKKPIKPEEIDKKLEELIGK